MGHESCRVISECHTVGCTMYELGWPYHTVSWRILPEVAAFSLLLASLQRIHQFQFMSTHTPLPPPRRNRTLIAAATPMPSHAPTQRVPSTLCPLLQGCCGHDHTQSAALPRLPTCTSFPQSQRMAIPRHHPAPPHRPSLLTINMATHPPDAPVAPTRCWPHPTSTTTTGHTMQAPAAHPPAPPASR